jgi:hypothetical protein
MIASGGEAIDGEIAEVAAIADVVDEVAMAACI